MLIGLSLSLLVMAAILSSYVFLARNFTRSLGVTYAVNNQTTLSQLPPLEAQLRTTLAYFSQDVRMATRIVSDAGPPSTPSANTVTLTLPTATGTTTVKYEYDAVARTLTRTWAGLPAQIIHHNLLGCTFTYYDAAGRPYTTYVDNLLGIKQLSVAFTAQGGSATNQTLTQVYTGASPRLLLRNRTFLP
jgi:hypothetical protein